MSTTNTKTNKKKLKQNYINHRKQKKKLKLKHIIPNANLKTTTNTQTSKKINKYNEQQKPHTHKKFIKTNHNTHI